MPKLIDADAVRRIILSHGGDGAMLREIERLPGERKEPLTGRWEFDEVAGDYFCSECGRMTMDRHDEWEDSTEFGLVCALKLPYYCGYCGADMRGR